MVRFGAFLQIARRVNGARIAIAVLVTAFVATQTLPFGTVTAFSASVQPSSRLRSTKTSIRLSQRRNLLQHASSDGSTDTDTDTNTDATSVDDTAKAYLDRARQMRQQIADLTGQTLAQVEAEAAATKQERQERALSSSIAQKNATNNSTTSSQRGTQSSKVSLSVPDCMDDQIWQAKAAIERAFADNVTRQIVRFALIPDGETLWERDRSWPGGAQQMVREAVGPTTRGLLQQLRCVAATTPTPTLTASSSDESSHSTATAAPTSLTRQPVVSSQDVWDFDGSALVTAQAANGPLGDVQALVQANTDNRYTKDIATIHADLGPSRLFLLVNPFWRNVTSWGFNILAPRAAQYAQEVIWDECHFVETYVVLQKSVRGEDCVALKVYPYDWQLYAYSDDVNNGYYSGSTPIHLGSTEHEPTSSDFASQLNKRPEFQLGKTMRRLEQRRNRF